MHRERRFSFAGKSIFVRRIVGLSIFLLTTRPVEGQTNFEAGSVVYSLFITTPYHALIPALYRNLLDRLRGGLFFRPLADGGSDGSDSGDSSGSTDGSDSSSSSSSDDSATPSDNSDATDAVSPPADPTDPNNAMDPATQQAYDAYTNPFGGYPGPLVFQNGSGDSPDAGSIAGSPIGPGRPGAPAEPGPLPPGAPITTQIPPPGEAINAPSPRRAQIHAVIVSSLPDPSQVLSGNVNLTGGIIAVGPANPGAPQKAGRWDPNVEITPDPELLNGNKIPPLVPNVFDVRIMHHEVSATIESTGSVSDRP
jgi:hypothetical protein